MLRAGDVRSRVVPAAWWVGAALSSALVLAGAIRTDISRLPPETPFDNTGSGHAEQWRFLVAASDRVPADATFTVHAADPDTEMSLYMMSVGLLPGSTAIPASYWGRPVAAAADARFVLDFGAEVAETAESQRSVALPGGFLTDRALKP
jgi:hypothetical protein